jgi:transketolase
MALRQAGVSVQHLHINSVRPLDVDAIVDAIAGTKATVVAENHLVTGGLGSAICELVVDRGLARRVVRLGLQDSYGGPGSLHYLLTQHGIDAQSIIRAAEGALGLAPGIQVGAQANARRSLW